MFKNYIVTAYRNILRHKLYSMINIFGLAIGMASCLLILLFVQDELSYDNWIPEAERIYRVQTHSQLPGRAPLVVVRAPGPARETFLQEFPQIEYATRIFRSHPIIRQGEKSFFETVTFADESFFKVFDLPFTIGEKTNALTENNTIYLSENMAKKYFGNASPLGKILSLNNKRDYKIVGVFKDLPRNSHLELDFLARFELNDYKDRTWVAEYWTSLNTFLYLKLRKNISPNVVSDRFKNIVATKVPPLKVGEAEFIAADVMTLSLHNVRDIHLKSEGLGGIKPGGDIIIVYIFSTVAVLILIIACINFMNLSTARSLQRAREIGLRKMAGATRPQLITQFLGETIFLSFMALILALGIVEIILPWYNEFIGKQLRLDYFSSSFLTLSLIGLIATVGILGGLYPALYLSSFQPSRALKASQSNLGGESGQFRFSLVVFQFSISTTLMICTAIVYDQTNYIQNLDVGFSKGNKLILRGIGRDAVKNVHETLAREIGNLEMVEDFSFSLVVPSDVRENDADVIIPGETSTESVILSRTDVDDNYFKTYNIPIIAGRDFSNSRGQDELHYTNSITTPPLRASVIINESGYRQIGFNSAEESIGKIITIGTQDSKTGLRNELEIIGIVPDVHFMSLKRNIRPFIYVFSDKRYNNLTIKYRQNTNIPELVTQLEEIWQKIIPGLPIKYDFLDDYIARQYDTDRNKGQLFATFAGLAIIIACMGLYGLAAFTAEQRTREIGIRKILGASMVDIISLLVWQITKPVVVANIIAWPLAFYFARDYLNAFQYRIDISAMLFIAASLVTLIIAWITVTWHAAKVARAKPINALRYE